MLRTSSRSRQTLAESSGVFFGDLLLVEPENGRPMAIHTGGKFGQRKRSCGIDHGRDNLTMNAGPCASGGF